MSTPTGTDRPARRGNALLWLAGGAFAVLLGAWTLLALIAWRHPVAPVPVVAPGKGAP
jgi:hypothetical protein